MSSLRWTAVVLGLIGAALGGFPRSAWTQEGTTSEIRAMSDARREYREKGQRARIEYPLTKMGAELSLPFMAMTAWGDKWLAEGEPQLALHSRSSGQRLRVAMIDERGKLAKSSDVQIVIRGKAWPSEERDKPRRKSG